MKLAPYELLACMMYVCMYLMYCMIKASSLLSYLAYIHVPNLINQIGENKLLPPFNSTTTYFTSCRRCCYTEDRVHEVFIFYFSFSFHSHYLG